MTWLQIIIVTESNTKIMSGIKPGSHLAIEKMGGLYHHHAIFIGRDHGVLKVIEYSGFGGSGESKVQKRYFDDFKGSGKVVVINSPKCFDSDEVVDRAKSRMGEDCYDLLFNNCEHFANWCRSGNHESQQINRIANPVSLGLVRVVQLAFDF